MCPTLCKPMNYAVHGIIQVGILEWVAFPFSRESSQPRDQTQVSHMAGIFFTIWAPEKPKNTGAGSLLLLQQIFLIQGWNQCLLHCRRILYQLIYQGSSQIHHNMWIQATSCKKMFNIYKSIKKKTILENDCLKQEAEKASPRRQHLWF